ncbi:MAG: hypothetical protein LBT98_03925 [Puniceicoccales bacterium]|nr:hypothetical protein [Puniceicoccales bacterium]
MAKRLRAAAGEGAKCGGTGLRMGRPKPAQPGNRKKLCFAKSLIDSYLAAIWLRWSIPGKNFLALPRKSAHTPCYEYVEHTKVSWHYRQCL